jgi:NAD(P)-dependent dehydrogenase (short-subunit alcohol dehydrogenase family)
MLFATFKGTFKEAINILGGLDILINNVGVINEIDFSRTIDVNVVKFFLRFRLTH